MTYKLRLDDGRILDRDDCSETAAPGRFVAKVH